MPAPRPTIYLIAGCNGVGKTTFAKEFLPHETNGDKQLPDFGARAERAVRRVA